MSEFRDIYETVPPELGDLEDLRAKTRVYEERARAAEFASREEQLENQSQLIAHLKEEWALGADAEVQDRVVKLGRLSFGKLVEIRVGRELRDDQATEMSEEEVASAKWLRQSFDFFKRYGTHTSDARRFKDDLIIKTDAPVEGANPWEELVRQKPVSVKAARHYLVGSDDSLTRISDDLTHIDIVEEGYRIRALDAVAHSKENGVTAKELFVFLYGKEDKYDPRRLSPILDWLKNIPMHNEKLVVSFGKNQAEKIMVSPSFELELDSSVTDFEESTPERDSELDYEEHEVSEETERQMQNICRVAHYLHGYNDVLEAYGHPQISDEMLKVLEAHIPKLDRAVEVTRQRKIAFDEILENTSTMELLVEFVYNINDAGRHHKDNTAKALDQFVRLLEDVKGRELFRIFSEASSQTSGSLTHGFLERDTKLYDANDREIWPNIQEELRNNK